MTTTQTTAKKKAHDGGMSFSELINDLRPPTPQELASEPTLAALYDFAKGSNQSQNQLFMIDTNLTTVHGNVIEKDIELQGLIAALMQNNRGEAVNLAYPNPNSRGSFSLLNSNVGAYVFGSLTDGCEPIAANGFLDGEVLARHLPPDKPIIISPNEAAYYSMVKHFSKKFAVIALADSANTDEVCSTLDGFNVKVITTAMGVINDLELGDLSYNHIVNDPKTSVKRLTKAATTDWKPLGDISDPESKATRYPIEAWGAKGSVLREAVEAIAYHAQAPDAIAGQCMLGNLATILQQYINAPYALNRRFMPVSLFLLTEADSGGGKSRTVGLSHKMLTEFQKQKRKEDKQLESEWKAQKAITPRKELERWLLDNPPPKKTIIFAKNGTIQGFLDNMLLGNTANVAWATAEAAMFLGGHSLTSETASSNIAQICDIWSGGEFDRLLSPRYDTINETGISGIRFSLDLQGQPAIIEPALNNELMNGQGLLPRFLFAFPDNMNGKIVYNTPERMDADPDSDPRLIDYWRRCQALLEPCQPRLNDDGSVKRFDMPFANRAARQALADYQTRCEAQLIKGGRLEKYASYAKRLHENASRIAAIMAYFDGRTSISADDIHRATTLTDYSMTERIRYTDKPQSGDNNTQKLLNWLIKHCRKESVTHIAYATAQSKATPKTLRAKHTFDLLIEVLENEHYIKVIQDGRARHIELRPELLGG